LALLPGDDARFFVVAHTVGVFVVADLVAAVAAAPASRLDLLLI
jgi:hypothetical protein